jgi:hypothetical protein
MIDHPITPPHQLVQQWAQIQAAEQAVADHWHHIATRAAQWGADQELEACVKLLELSDKNARDFLYSARRAKLPSWKEQALDQLKSVEDRYGLINTDYIRRALEQLDD